MKKNPTSTVSLAIRKTMFSYKNNTPLVEKKKLDINSQKNILVFNTENVTDPDFTQSILD